MLNKIDDVSKKVKSLINEHFIPVLENKISTEEAVLKSVSELFFSAAQKITSTHYNDDAPIDTEVLMEYHSGILDIIKTHHAESNPEDFDTQFKSLKENFNALFVEVETILNLYQKPERFKLLAGDSLQISIYKKIKSISYWFSQSPTAFTNVFRRLFKKELKPPKLWKQEIPFRDLCIYYFEEELSKQLMLPLIHTYKGISNAILSQWQALKEAENIIKVDKNRAVSEFETRVNEIKNKIEALKKTNIEESLTAISRVEESSKNSYEIAGTIELRKKQFSEAKFKKKHAKLNNACRLINEGWELTLYALLDDWRLSEELYFANYSGTHNYHQLVDVVEEKLNAKIIPGINNISAHLEEAKSSINNFTGSSGELKTFIASVKEKNIEKLSEHLVPSTIDTMVDENIPSIIDEFEIKLAENLKNLAKERVVVKTDNYENALRKSDIDHISPYELIAFESFPRLARSTKGLKFELLRLLENTQKYILDLEQIADFNLESAIASFDTELHLNKTPKNIAADGIDRAIGKADHAIEELKKIIISVEENVKKSLDEFNKNMLDLTSTEKIFQIKVRIAKAKALERSKKFKEDAVLLVKNFIPVAISKAKDWYEVTKDFYKRGRKIFGLAPKTLGISSEISDFLAETYKAIQLLPFVYQRLFKVEPLTTARFFEGREIELNQLNNAFLNWEKNYFAPVALVCEKGSGATTTINVFLQSLEFEGKIFRVSIEQPTYSEKDFLKLLSGLFNGEQFNCTGDVIQYLNSLPARHMVVMENLQHIYLKAVSGFNSFKMFFEIISRTNKNIFWVTTSTLYAWQYLDKTIQISDYFSYVINLKELTHNQIVGMINKRHRVSGYNILFRPSEDDLENKTYKKLNESEKQKYLREEYFSGLNKFTKSNISLALLFWLRSTTDVTKDTITIRSLKNLDFSFIGSLSNQKIFTLSALMLHDGLTVEAHAQIFNLTNTQSRLSLLVLFDDGIVIKKGEVFLINPLLYRQTVSLLQSKNIIH